MATIAVPTTRISGGSFLLEERQPDEVFTPEDFSEQHLLIAQTAEEFATNEIVPNIEKIEHKDFSVTRDLLKKAGELGLSSVEIPEAYGGLDRRSHCQVRRLRDDLGRAHGNRNAADCVFRYGRAEEEISAAIGRRGDRRSLRFIGSIVGLGCTQLSHPRSAFVRRQALHPEWREDVDHQCGIRGPV